MVVPIGLEGEIQRLEMKQKLGRGSILHQFTKYVSFEPCVDEKFQLDKWSLAQDMEMYHFVTPNMY